MNNSGKLITMDINSERKKFKIPEPTVPDYNPIRVNDRSYSRNEIAKGTGLSITHVSRIFSGKRLPSIHTASRLCAFLQITLDELANAIGCGVEQATIASKIA